MTHSLLPYRYLSHMLPYVSRQSLLYILCQRWRRTSLCLPWLLIYLLAPKPHLPASYFYHTRQSTQPAPAPITNSKCLGYLLPHPYPCRTPFWTTLCRLAGAFTTVMFGIHTSPPLVKQQHQYQAFKNCSPEKDRVSRFQPLPTSLPRP